MKTILKITLFSLFSAMMLLAAGVDGSWKSTFTAPDGVERTSTFVLQSDGEKLLGKIGGATGDAEIKNGAVKGADVSFQITIDYNGQPMLLRYEGKVDGDELKLKVTYNEEGSFEIVAKRQ